MEEKKQQELHDMLAKLAPKGKMGGLGYNALSNMVKVKDDTLPNNPLYTRFVRKGSCLGQYHKILNLTTNILLQK